MKDWVTILLAGVLLLGQTVSAGFAAAPKGCGGCPCQMVKSCCEEKPAQPEAPPVAPLPKRPDWSPVQTPRVIVSQPGVRLVFRVAAPHQAPSRAKVPVYLLTCRFLI